MIVETSLVKALVSLCSTLLRVEYREFLVQSFKQILLPHFARHSRIDCTRKCEEKGLGLSYSNGHGLFGGAE